MSPLIIIADSFVRVRPHSRHPNGAAERSGAQVWRGEPLAAQYGVAAAKPGVTVIINEIISVEDGHTGEEVIVTTAGLGSQRVTGFFPNTGLFDVIMDAFDWKRDR